MSGWISWRNWNPFQTKPYRNRTPPPDTSIRRSPPPEDETSRPSSRSRPRRQLPIYERPRSPDPIRKLRLGLLREERERARLPQRFEDDRGWKTTRQFSSLGQRQLRLFQGGYSDPSENIFTASDPSRIFSQHAKYLDPCRVAAVAPRRANHRS